MDFFKGLEFVLANGNRKRDSILHRKSFKDYYGVQFFNGEAFELKLQGRTWTVEGPCVLLTYPGPFFEYGPQAGTDTHHSYVCFRGPRTERYLESGLLPLDPELPLLKITAPQRLQEAMDMLLALPGLNDRVNHDLAVNMLENILLQLQNQPDSLSIAPRLQAKLSELQHELRQRPELEWDFHDEAKRMSISYIYLRTLFRKLTGMPPGAFLLKARIDKASKLLLNSDAQISEIAGSCGFADVFYFSRSFKKRQLISPLKYRKEFSSAGRHAPARPQATSSGRA